MNFRLVACNECSLQGPKIRGLTEARRALITVCQGPASSAACRALKMTRLWDLTYVFRHDPLKVIQLGLMLARNQRGIRGPRGIDDNFTVCRGPTKQLPFHVGCLAR